MFATIAARYPIPDPDDPDAALRATLADQLEAGSGLLGDGRVRTIATDADVDAAVTAWRAADQAARALAASDGLRPVPVKACLVGPCSTPGPTEAALELVRAAVAAVAAAGAQLIQVDEPWLASPEAATAAGRARALGAWDAIASGSDAHLTLAVPGGAAARVGHETLSAAPFSSYLLDLVGGPEDWRVAARLPGERGLVVGVIDARMPVDARLPVAAWAARYAASLRARGPDRVGLAPGSGLELLPRDTARALLATLADAARVAQAGGAERASSVDTWALEVRSAALGRWAPSRRRRSARGG